MMDGTSLWVILVCDIHLLYKYIEIPRPSTKCIVEGTRDALGWKGSIEKVRLFDSDSDFDEI